MYATDGQTDGRTKATLIVPFSTGGGIITDKRSNRLAGSINETAASFTDHDVECTYTYD